MNNLECALSTLALTPDLATRKIAGIWFPSSFKNGSEPLLELSSLATQMDWSERPDSFLDEVINLIISSKYHDQGSSSKYYADSIILGLAHEVSHELDYAVKSISNLTPLERILNSNEMLSAISIYQQLLVRNINTKEIPDTDITNFLKALDIPLSDILNSKIFTTHFKSVALNQLA